MLRSWKQLVIRLNKLKTRLKKPLKSLKEERCQQERDGSLSKLGELAL